MSYEITAFEVSAFIQVPDGVVDEYINVVNLADPCLLGAGVPDEVGKTLKRLAVAHMVFISQNSGRGAVTSESAPSGASRGFAAWAGKGISGSPFGSMLDNLDSSGCIIDIFGSVGSERKDLRLMSVGTARNRR